MAISFKPLFEYAQEQNSYDLYQAANNAEEKYATESHSFSTSWMNFDSYDQAMNDFDAAGSRRDIADSIRGNLEEAGFPEYIYDKIHDAMLNDLEEYIDESLFG